jgi:ribonuclease III
MPELAQLQARLGYQFRDEGLLRLALTHPSIAHESGVTAAGGDEAQRRPEHNQRLEFLGDAVLQLVLTRELYEKFPAFDEGPLTKARAKLVNRRTLAEHARALGLGAHLILGRGEEMHGGRERPSALADTFEALLGAIFLDGGFDAAREFILREFGAAFGKVSVLPIIENPKGELQELLQARSPEAPEYHVVSATGPDHDRVFECTVQHAGVDLAHGRGKSKKAAESDAASAALKKLRDQLPRGAT